MSCNCFVPLLCFGHPSHLRKYAISHLIMSLSSTSQLPEGSEHPAQEGIKVIRFITRGSWTLPPAGHAADHVVLSHMDITHLHWLSLPLPSSRQSEEEGRRHSQTIMGMTESQTPPQLLSPTSVSQTPIGKGAFSGIGEQCVMHRDTILESPIVFRQIDRQTDRETYR